MSVFVEILELAGESGARYNGVLCGRATWKGGIAAYATGGIEGLNQWLKYEGKSNIKQLNRILQTHATPIQVQPLGKCRL